MNCRRLPATSADARARDRPRTAPTFGEETIELSGLIAPELTGDPASLDLLRSMADEGRPLSLVDGTGVVHGAFVISSLNDTRTLFFADGAARRIEFQLSLLRVDDDAMADAGDAAPAA